MDCCFKVVTLDDLKEITKFRNCQMEMLRTPFLLTEEMQKDFFFTKINRRDSNCRFFSVFYENKLIGMVGLENIQWENRIAEISLITGLEYCHKIPTIFNKISSYAFNTLNLKSIFTEVYECSRHEKIWKTLAKENNAYSNVIPFRKFWDGEYYNSIIFTFIDEGK